MVVMQGKPIRRSTVPPGLRIMPFDFPPVVVAVQRARTIRQQPLMQPLDDRDRLVTLDRPDRTRTKINTGEEFSRLGSAGQPKSRSCLTVAITTVNGSLRRPQQSNRFVATLRNVVQLVLHYLRAQAAAAIGRRHGDNGYRGNRY